MTIFTSTIVALILGIEENTFRIFKLSRPSLSDKNSALRERVSVREGAKMKKRGNGQRKVEDKKYQNRHCPNLLDRLRI